MEQRKTKYYEMLLDHTNYIVVYNKEFYRLKLWDISIPALLYKIVETEIWNFVDIPDLMDVIRKEIMLIKDA